MSQEVGQTELKAKTQQLLDGPLKHIRAAAIAAALLPLASVAATPASAETCGSGGNVCGVVWNDTNHNGTQDGGEVGLDGVRVTLVTSEGDTLTYYTGSDGTYYFTVPDGTYTIQAQVPTGYQTSPSNVGSNDTIDSDGVPNGGGLSIATNVTVSGSETGSQNSDTDFGFVSSTALNPGTGTPGYWKNHPGAWPVNSITVGGISYSKDDAIMWLGKVSRDKTTTMFSSLVPAMLNVMIGNDGSCINATIAAANAWMATYGPVGSGVAASSYAWSVGEPLHQTMDIYNNGQLCAPHRK
jgi:hypothetical protein